MEREATAPGAGRGSGDGAVSGPGAGGTASAGGPGVLVGGVSQGGVVRGSVMRFPPSGPGAEGARRRATAAPRGRHARGAGTSAQGTVTSALLPSLVRTRSGSTGLQGTGVRPALSALVRSPEAFGPTLGLGRPPDNPGVSPTGTSGHREKVTATRRPRGPGTGSDDEERGSAHDPRQRPAAVAELDRLDEAVRSAPAGDTSAQIALWRQAARLGTWFFIARGRGPAASVRRRRGPGAHDLPLQQRPARGRGGPRARSGGRRDRLRAAARRARAGGDRLRRVLRRSRGRRRRARPPRIGHHIPSGTWRCSRRGPPADDPS